jgi:hypothetical protein
MTGLPGDAEVLLMRGSKMPLRGAAIEVRAGAPGWHNTVMAVGRAERRRERAPRAMELFGEERAQVALDLLELTELAWHDCYGESTPPDDVIEDVLLLSEGSIERLVQAARLTVIDRRDLKLAVDELRGRA